MLIKPEDYADRRRSLCLGMELSSALAWKNLAQDPGHSGNIPAIEGRLQKQPLPNNKQTSWVSTVANSNLLHKRRPITSRETRLAKRQCKCPAETGSSSDYHDRQELGICRWKSVTKVTCVAPEV